MTLAFLSSDESGQDSADEKYDLPKYSSPGWVLFEVASIDPFTGEMEIDNVTYDAGGSPFWIQEFEGFDYWINENVDLEMCGFYIIEGISGDYHKGTWGFDDDDVYWNFQRCRRASDEEVKSGEPS